MGIIKAYRELGHKKFMLKFKEGLAKIPPQDLLKIRLMSLTGQAIGVVIAALVTFLYGIWYIGIIMVFVFIYTLTMVVEVYQAYNNIKKFQELLKGGS